METKRRPLQGVLNILSFNRHFYVAGLAVLAALFAGKLYFNWPPLVFELIVIAFLYGLIMPLIVSAWVYDFSGYYNFHWLTPHITNDAVGQIVNINAGFDETSFIIKHRFPDADLQVFDFYNAGRHTEPAIKRARKVSLVYPNTKQIASGVIPVADKTIDVIFLLSAVHEIRSNDEKVQFLKECYRICKPNGKVVMVEHFRKAFGT